MRITLAELTRFVQGNLVSGDSVKEITGFASLEDARAGDLTFFYDSRYAGQMSKTQASAILVPMGWTECPADASCIAVQDPSRSFERVVEAYGLQPVEFEAGVHSSAVVSESATFDPARVSIGAHAVIERGASLGDNVEVGAGCYVGRGVQLGNGCKLNANSTVHADCLLGQRVILHSSSVIGSDGFGYVFEKGCHRKIRQAGIVQVDDDVEIGAGSTIDRARFGRTWIGEGTKIDNLVQIGHNVVLGKHCIVVACSAIAGSVVVGDHVVIAAQVGIAGHVKVGSQSRLGARCGVTRDLPAGQTYLGFPAVEAAEEKRRIAGARRLPQLMKRVKRLEEQLPRQEEP